MVLKRAEEKTKNQSKSELGYGMNALQDKKSIKHNQTTTNTDFLEKEYVLKGLGKMAH